MLIEKNGQQMTVAKSAFKDIFAPAGWQEVLMQTKSSRKAQRSNNQDTGYQMEKPLSEMSSAELKELAAQYGLDYRNYNKEQLMHELQAIRG